MCFVSKYLLLPCDNLPTLVLATIKNNLNIQNCCRGSIILNHAPNKAKRFKASYFTKCAKKIANFRTKTTPLHNLAEIGGGT